jgi:hypothetical protein
MALKIYTQGSLDGLCGVYAFVNGYIHLCTPYRFMVDSSIGGDFSIDLCQFALKSIPKKSFPEVIWSGMNFQTLMRVCKKTCATIEREVGHRHRVLSPFHAGQFRSVDKFFEELAKFRDEVPTTFAILGFEGGSDHWAVMKSDEGHTIRLLNNGKESFLEKSKISFGKTSSHRLMQDETIIVQMLPF